MCRSETGEWETADYAGLESGIRDGVCEGSDHVVHCLIIENPFLPSLLRE